MKTFWLLVMCTVALFLIAYGGGCDCGDDDDDNNDSANEPPPANAREVVERIITNLDTQGQNGAWVAYVLTEPLEKNDQVASAGGEADEEAIPKAETYVPEGDYWFSFVDEDPYALFEHPATYVYLDTQTSEMTEVDEKWWPEINGTAMSMSGLDLMKVYAPAPTDGNEVGSYEKLDESSDENNGDAGIFFVVQPDYQSGKVSARFLVSPPAGDNFANIVVDTNRDGVWAKNEMGKEWLIENESLSSPGSGQWVWTSQVQLPLDQDNKFTYEAWVRIAFSSTKIEAGEDGWGGSGEYDQVEDAFFNFLPWAGPGYDADDFQEDAIGPEVPDVEYPEPEKGAYKNKIGDSSVYICEADNIEVPIERKALVINLGDRHGQDMMYRDAGRAWLWFETLLGSGKAQVMQKPTEAQALTAIQNFLSGMKCLDELYLYIVGHGRGDNGSIRVQNGAPGHNYFQPSELETLVNAHSHCPDPMNYYMGECRQPGYCNLNLFLMSCHSGHWTDRPNGVNRDGMNTLTAASAGLSAWMNRVNFMRVANAFWRGHTGTPGNQLADQPPFGNGDGTVSNEEAMKYATDHGNYGGTDSQPQSKPNADCNCECNSEATWTWTDPLDDLIYWLSKADPTYVGNLDIVSYGISLTGDGFDANITTAEDLPGALDTGFHEYYAVFDANASWPNYLEAGESPTGGGDTAYIAQFLNGNWTMFLFLYLPSDGWTQQFTSSTVEVSGDSLVMHIDNVEAGITDAQSVDVHMTTWYKEGGTTNAGDDTDVEQFTYSDTKGCR